jgi:hypothetical protein
MKMTRTRSNHVKVKINPTKLVGLIKMHDFSGLKGTLE